ncbi:MAG: alpha/beta hydrolase-fold protein [Acidobacteriota bacterium]|nr:alpha/beta hydrolase-fold protein [Blastocatellia bacterium]MDW8413509.1 alpha/beta hydrolase-fold protein [Acidobacteriota bacterium]
MSILRLSCFLLLLLNLTQARTLETGFLNRQIKLGKTVYRYQVYVPVEYSKNEKWPVILFLHGSGERGSDGLLQTEVGLASAIRRRVAAFKSIVVFPQCPSNLHWTHDAAKEIALATLEASIVEFGGDRSRVYLTGISMGGAGTWYLAAEHSDVFTAIVPICGWVKPPDGHPITASLPPMVKQICSAPDPYTEIANRIRHIPVWIFHSKDDGVISVDESRKMYEALSKLRAEVCYTEYEGLGHQAWDKAYSEPELITWLFGHSTEKHHN